ncbi:MAG: hypothetical protein HKN47_22300 [Pirellulaceae bacterium]|nr:hypothetical protein [Pirellulaceae bacterium]
MNKVTRWIATTRTRVWGQRNSWSLSQPANSPNAGVPCNVIVEIQGTPHDGYHVVMSPDGFFTADTWCESLDEAFNSGKELFDIERHDWQEIAD